MNGLAALLQDEYASRLDGKVGYCERHSPRRGVAVGLVDDFWHTAFERLDFTAADRYCC